MKAPLKIFIYRMEDCHLEPGCNYRPAPVLSEPNPEFFEQVGSPAEADFIVFPIWLTDVGASHVADQEYVYSYLPKLPYFHYFPERHVFFLPGVDTWAPLFNSAVTFRTSLHRKFLDLNAVAIPYYEEQMTEAQGVEDAIYHTVFVGFPGSWSGRPHLVKALSEARGITCMWRCPDHFHYHENPEKRAEDLKAYRDSFSTTITVCCPRGAGLNSIRFFETLAAGRIPILISDDCVLPLEDQINYAAFSIRLPEFRIPEIGTFLADWFVQTPPEEVARMCATARLAWEEHLGPAAKEKLIVNALHRIKDSGYRLNVAQMADVQALRRATNK